MIEDLTPAQRRAEYDILALKTEDTGKFALAIGYLPAGSAAHKAAFQDALERLMLRDWIRLIDISPVADPKGQGQVLRIFRVMPDALDWFEGERAKRRIN